MGVDAAWKSEEGKKRERDSGTQYFPIALAMINKELCDHSLNNNFRSLLTLALINNDMCEERTLETQRCEKLDEGKKRERKIV